MLDALSAIIKSNTIIITPAFGLIRCMISAEVGYVLAESWDYGPNIRDCA